MRTVTTANRGELALADWIVKYHGNHNGTRSGDGRVYSVDDPIGTVDTSNRFGLMEGGIVPFFGERAGQSPRSHSLDDPLPTVTGHSAGGLFRPFAISYYGNGGPVDVDEPMGTATTRDRFALVSPDLVSTLDKGTVIVGLVDIGFRMFTDHELSAGQGFPKTYFFVGTRKDRIKQIGNAVEVNIAQSLIGEVLDAEVSETIAAEFGDVLGRWIMAPKSSDAHYEFYSEAV